MAETALADAWTRLIAPRTGNLRADLVADAAEFLGMSTDAAWSRLNGATERFRDEWTRTVSDPHDAGALQRFYNQSEAEIFDLIEWHATDPIHYRTLILRDLASTRRGRAMLDFGSGIGNDALVFAHAGFEVTLADISDPLLAFAAWRCERRGFRVRTIDLKRNALPATSFDVALCLDVLEHIPRPLPVVRQLRGSLRKGGLLAVHAPFGEDPERPMHVVHRDVITPRMRSLGLLPIDHPFPTFVRAPRIYEKRVLAAAMRVGYYLYDRHLNNAIGYRLAAVHRLVAGRKRARSVGA